MGSSSIRAKLNLTSRWLIRGCQPSKVPGKLFSAVLEMAVNLEPSLLGAEAVWGCAAAPIELRFPRRWLLQPQGCCGCSPEAPAGMWAWSWAQGEDRWLSPKARWVCDRPF